MIFMNYIFSRIFLGFRILFFIFLFFIFPFSSVAAATGDIFITPAHQSDEKDIRTKSWFVYTLSPGTRYKDAFFIQNQSPHARQLKLYPVDAYITEQGGFALRRHNEEKRTVGAWVRLENNEITLAPGQSKEIAFVYEVPKGIEPGDYAGGIVAEEAPPLSSGGIQIIKRVGVRLYHTVPGSRTNALKSFEEKKIGERGVALPPSPSSIRWWIFTIPFGLILIGFLTFPKRKKKSPQ